MFAIGCQEWVFEISLDVFSNTEIADWLTSNRDGDEAWQGEASLTVGDKSFELYPTTMTYGDMNGSWEITMADVRDGPVWESVATASVLSVALGKFERIFTVVEDGKAELRRIADVCSNR